jgi:hypothetical protein
MPRIAYSVVATLPDAGVADEYIRWLTGGHVQQVVSGGAESGLVLRLLEPADAIRVETRYLFPSREAYDRYIRDFAPPLREEGLRLFGPDRGVRMERRLAEVLG